VLLRYRHRGLTSKKPKIVIIKYRVPTFAQIFILANSRVEIAHDGGSAFLFVRIRRVVDRAELARDVPREGAVKTYYNVASSVVRNNIYYYHNTRG